MARNSWDNSYAYQFRIEILNYLNDGRSGEWIAKKIIDDKELSKSKFQTISSFAQYLKRLKKGVSESTKEFNSHISDHLERIGTDSPHPLKSTQKTGSLVPDFQEDSLKMQIESFNTGDYNLKPTEVRQPEEVKYLGGTTEPHVKKNVNFKPDAAEPKQLTYSESGNKAEIESKGRIKSLDELLQAANVDLSVWFVERHVINKWEVGAKNAAGEIEVKELFQVKAWLKRSIEAHNYNIVRGQLLQDIQDYAPKYTRVKYKKTAGNYMLELSVYDMHIGKLAWDEESGENYDSYISSSLFITAIDDLCNKARAYNVEKILFPIGNDFLHTDGLNNMTTAGTSQDVDTRYHKMFRIAREACVTAIERLRMIAPVEVTIVPGNHDNERSFYLGDSLQGWFRNCPGVMINNAPTLRKCVQYGKCMIYLTHGSEEKITDLPLLMAVEYPQIWADTLYREVRIGHWHGKNSIQYKDINEIKGVRIRIISSLTAADAWHSKKGFVGNIRAAEAFIWNKEKGVEAELSYNL